MFLTCFVGLASLKIIGMLTNYNVYRYKVDRIFFSSKELWENSACIRFNGLS